MFSQRGHCSSAITQPRAAAPRQDLLQLDVCTCAHQSSLLGDGDGWCLNLCAHLGVFICECLFVLIFAVFLGVYECFCGRAAQHRLVLGLEIGAPNSGAAKVQSAAVPVNDV